MRNYLFIIVAVVIFSSCRKEAAFEFHKIEYYYIESGDTISTLFAPNSVTPDGDGRNDLFKVVVTGFQVNTFEISIFDSYQTNVFISDDINSGWDGMYKGQMLQNGLYRYTIDYTAVNGHAIHFENEIMLLR